MTAEALARIDTARKKLGHGGWREHDPMTRLFDELRMMVPEQPSDDEREALARIVADFMQPGGYEVTESDYTLADRIVASPVWRNRHRGLITDEAVAAAVTAYAECIEEGGEMAYMRAALEAAEAHRA